LFFSPFIKIKIALCGKIKPQRTLLFGVVPPLFAAGRGLNGYGKRDSRAAIPLHDNGCARCGLPKAHTLFSRTAPGCISRVHHAFSQQPKALFADARPVLLPLNAVGSL